MCNAQYWLNAQHCAIVHLCIHFSLFKPLCTINCACFINKVNIFFTSVKLHNKHAKYKWIICCARHCACLLCIVVHEYCAYHATVVHCAFLPTLVYEDTATWWQSRFCDVIMSRQRRRSNGILWKAVCRAAPATPGLVNLHCCPPWPL